jgi:predicted SAM-dependent methyltransferase
MPGHTNLDIDESVKPDIVDDARYLEKIKDGSVEAITASHVLEHFEHFETLDVLKTWNRKLVSGGLLFIVVPDIEFISWQLVRNPKNDKYIRDMFGGQLDEWDYHKTGFTKQSLAEFLEQAGFRVMSCDTNYGDDYACIVCMASKI